MQVFVRTLQGRTCQVQVDPRIEVNELQRTIQAVVGIQVTQTRVTFGGTTLQPGRSLASYGISRDSTLHLLGSLRGGKPVKVKIVTDHLSCGQEVTIDLEPEAGKDEVKTKLEAATGVPAQHQKIMLAGIGQLVMADKRTNILFGSCGHTGGLHLAVMSTGSK